MKKIIIWCLLLAIGLFCFTSCGGSSMLEPVPFNLKPSSEDFDPPRQSFIRNSTEFNEFLSDRSVFNENFEQDFISKNKEFDDEFFEDNDLIALILQAPTRMIKGHKLNSLTASDGCWVLKMSSVSGKSERHDDVLGPYFCYYIAVQKDTSINGVKIEFS
ncbi:MAG: hypothetical protein IJ292_01870 [Clostridia bacterium]|nr:hypothetical protein [Clostridia bacterium]